MSGGFRSLRRISFSTIRFVWPSFHIIPARARNLSVAPACKSNVFPAEDVDQRLEELDTATAQLYPRIGSYRQALSCRTFGEQYGKLDKGELRPDDDVVVHGMQDWP